MSIIPSNIVGKDAVFKYLKDNAKLIERQKKSVIKLCDPVLVSMGVTNDREEYANKEAIAMSADNNTGFLNIKIVGNTTNVLDSHMDVHIDGLWKKTLKENKYILHLQEHEMEFEKIISDDTNVYTKNTTFESLGSQYTGNTQALVMESKAPIDRNTYMCDQYRKGYVKNHSVGMIYVTYLTCINSKEKYYADEYENWQKYYPLIVNPKLADEEGYFFAVLEAKLIEISAVPIGSNRVTPTQSVTEDKNGADIITSSIIEPVITTQKSNLEPLTKIKFT